MYKSLSIVSLVAAVAVAQSTLVPADASDNCKAFLTKLNDDAALAKCTGALSTALAAFAPGADTGSSSAVSTALTSVCGDDVASQCPTSVFASQITGFYQACSAELTTAPNPAVVKIYDVLYVVPAMREAICAKDDDGSWCVAAAAPPAGSSASDVQAALFSREGGNVVPNTDAFTRYNVPFLFLTADSPDLCKTCTRNVLNAFIKHESNLPYAPGLTNSQLLNTQSELYAGVQKTCGESFMVSEIAAAGGLGSNGISGVLNGNKSGAMSNVDARFSSLIAAIAGFASFAALF